MSKSIEHEMNRILAKNVANSFKLWFEIDVGKILFRYANNNERKTNL